MTQSITSWSVASDIRDDDPRRDLTLKAPPPYRSKWTDRWHFRPFQRERVSDQQGQGASWTTDQAPLPAVTAECS